MRNSLVRKASVRPKQLSARLPVFRNVRGSSADEVLGHFTFVAALVGELQGERTVHISAGWVAGDQGAAMSAVRDRYIATARARCMHAANVRTCARVRGCKKCACACDYTHTCCHTHAEAGALYAQRERSNKGPSCVVATASFPANGPALSSVKEL